ncbi:TPA: autotransporter outer membrane beta-barrel domain-containing protein [Kluyvera cryocrescens]|nr:autotransporter outer membrane beta-barrel domain-containing protein [Kluyvera cryocrescens]
MKMTHEFKFIAATVALVIFPGVVLADVTLEKKLRTTSYVFDGTNFTVSEKSGINTSVATPLSYGVLITLANNITNNSFIISPSISILNTGVVNGSITNNGTLTSVYGISSDVQSVIRGDVTNSGTITTTKAGISMWSTLYGNVMNSGIITDNLTGIANNNGAVIHGNVFNSGSITAQGYGVYNDGTISGVVINSNTVTGRMYAILNKGIITGGVINSGVLNGDVDIGSGVLNLLSSNSAIVNNPVINGDIIGENDSIINVGTEGGATKFTTAGNATVGKLVIASESQLDLSDSAIWNASTEKIINNGTISLSSSASSATLEGNMVNNGAIVLNSCTTCAGHLLNINGDYNGNFSKLFLGTVLAGDNSLTDKLAITGNATGTTYVYVTNEGGTGAQTLNGIEIITTGTSTADAFVQSGRIAAGAYDYSLVRGTGSNSGNWYLSSTLPPTTTTGSTSGSTSTPVQRLRPEAGAYIANLAAVNSLFATSLHDRLGETHYMDVLTGEKKVTSMWLRNEGGHNRSRDSSGQLSTQANRYIAQLGGDLAQWSSDGSDRYHLGFMAGYANSKSNTRSKISGHHARGMVEGYSAGLYGSWYQNDAYKTGLYVDTQAQYNWFKNTVNGQGLSIEKYDSRGVTASVESGYTFRLGQSSAGTQTYFIQPKVQVTWMGVKAGRHSESNGTMVSGEGDGNVQTHLGVKTFLNGHSKLDEGKDRNFQPFAEVNWVHNTHDFGSRMDGDLVKQDGAANIAEMKVGVEGQLSPLFGLWGNVAQQLGNKGYRDTSAMLGGKYSF